MDDEVRENMGEFYRIDGRFWAIFALSAVFWIISVASQRMNRYGPRVEITHWLAFLLGSKTDMVMWRTATIQIGVLINLMCYAAILWVWGVSNLLIPFMLSSVITLALQRIKPHIDG